MSLRETSLNASGRALTQIRQWLRDGTLPPGTMLSEHELAGRLEMSRTPVRAAIRHLEAEGWLTIYPQRGALVRGLSAEEARAVSEARQILESAYIDSLSDNARTALCERLERSIQEQINELQHGSYERLVQLTIDFHRAFVEVGNNPVLLDFYERTRERQALMGLHTYDQIAGRWEQFIGEHRQLLELTRSGDRTAFLNALQSHIMETHGTLLKNPAAPA